MYRPRAGSGLALTLRRLRGRFGITAPRVAVRTHLPWHWRVLAVIVILAAALALAGWIYDTGRRFAGFDRGLSESEITALRDRATALEDEVTKLRGIANAAGNTQQMDKTAIDQLTRQVRSLEDENVRLKENLAVFENLANGGAKASAVSLARLRVEPDGQPGRYRYRILAAWRGADARQEFKGMLQFHVTVQSGATQSATIIVPRADDPAAGRFAVSFRSVRSLEGTFQLPPEAKVRRVEARLIQDGAIKASQSISL
jgi:hypothetical protein